MLKDMIEIHDFMNELNHHSSYNTTYSACEKTLDVWAVNKQPLYELLGNQLIETVEITSDASKEDVMSKVREFRDEVDNSRLLSDDPLRNLFSMFCRLNYESYKNNEIKSVDAGMLLKSYVSNSYNKGISDLGKDNYEISNIITRFKDGGKLTKLLSALFGDAISQIYSKYIAQFKIRTEKVHFSIDPIDFINMSHGNSWSSCYSTKDDGGCYSAGVMNYIADKITVIAWIGELENRRTKQWRQCLYIDPSQQVLIGSRQYPGNKSEEFTLAIRKYWQEKFEKLNFNGEEQVWKLVKNQKVIANEITHEGTDTMYSDIHCYSLNDTYYAMYPKESFNSPKDIESLKMGEEAYCVDCGRTLESERAVSCCEDNSVWCQCCDDVVLREDEGTIAYSSRGREIVVCESCLEQYYIRCEDCGEYHDEDYTHYDIENFGIVCKECYEENDYYECECCEQHYREFDSSKYDVKGMVVCENCADDAFGCDLCGEKHWESDSVEINGVPICSDCVDKCATTCEGCENTVLTCDTKEHNGSTYCDDCYDDIVESSGDIK